MNGDIAASPGGACAPVVLHSARHRGWYSGSMVHGWWLNQPILVDLRTLQAYPLRELWLKIVNDHRSSLGHQHLGCGPGVFKWVRPEMVYPYKPRFYKSPYLGSTTIYGQPPKNYNPYDWWFPPFGAVPL